jgi:hypothetical protein
MLKLRPLSAFENPLEIVGGFLNNADEKSKEQHIEG